MEDKNLRLYTKGYNDALELVTEDVLMLDVVDQRLNPEQTLGFHKAVSAVLNILTLVKECDF